MAEPSKSALYELIQKIQSEHKAGGSSISRPLFNESSRLDRATNTTYFTCNASLTYQNKTIVTRSDIKTTKSEANQDACAKLYAKIIKIHPKQSNQPSQPDRSSQSGQTKEIDLSQKEKNSSKSEDITHDDEQCRSRQSGDDRISVLSSDTVIINKKLLILIDYENVSHTYQHKQLSGFLNNVMFDDTSDDARCAYSAEHEFLSEPVSVIKFAGKISTLKATADVIVNSTRKDAVDHYIGYYIGGLITKYPDLDKTHSIHILTRDHFASCIEDFNPNIKHNVDVPDLISTIVSSIDHA